jgi:DNA-binding transcriptional ArsR family regulator
MALPKTKNNKKDGVEQIVAKAFAHPLRVQILIILNEKTASPNMLAQQLDESLNLVAYHVRVLEKYDCIELVNTKQRRGATEHFYRATRRQLLTDDQWAQMPASLRPGMAEAILKSIFEDIESASKSGMLDKVDDVHVTRTPMVVDQEGWTDISTLLEGTLNRLLEIQAESSERMADSNEEGRLTKVHLLHFESPKPNQLDGTEATDETEAVG